MFDTHAHVNFADFKDDYEEVIKRAVEKNCTFINVGSQFSTSARAVKSAEENENIYAAIGLHPIHLVQRKIKEKVDDKEDVEITSRAEKFDYNKYKELALASKKVVAIGECGIDYHHLEPDNKEEQIAEQKKVFIEQIKLANDLDLPMIIHCRDAYDDLIKILEANEVKNRGTVHCFGGNLEQARKLIKMGFYLGFTGVITFKNIDKELLEVIKQIPEDKILSETDCPYLTPEPYRGKRNEPVYVDYVIRKIAELRDWSYEKALEVTAGNARRLFKI